jgi:hypothetical protein
VERIAVGLLIGLGALFVLSTLAEVYRNFKWMPRVDFTMYHTAAKVALAQESLYHFHEPGGFQPGNLPYPYPPLLACLLAPLARLPLATAYHLWVGVIVACFGLLVWLSARVVRECGGPRPLLLAVAAMFLAMILVDSNVYWGQVNVPVMTLVAAAVLLGLRGRTGWAGALIGVATALKLLPAALMLWFLVRRDVRALGAFFATLVAGVLLVPMLVGGPSWAWQMNREWLALVFGAVTQGADGLQAHGGYVTGYKNGSLAAVFDRLFGGAGRKGALVIRLPQPTIDSITTLVRLAVLAASAAATVRLWRRRTPAVERWLLPLAASMLLLLGWLFNLILWDHHTVGLVLILPVVTGAALDPRLDPGWRRALWLGLIAGAAGLASGWFSGSRRWGIQTLCLLLLWGGLAWALIHAPPPAPGGEQPEAGGCGPGGRVEKSASGDDSQHTLPLEAPPSGPATPRTNETQATGETT